MELNDTRVNPTSEVEGVWVDVADDAAIKLARYMNPSHKKYIQHRLEPYKAMIRRNAVPDSVMEAIELDATLKHVLLGWRGLMKGGKKLTYTEAAARELMVNPAFNWFPEFVKESSQDMTLFREQELEDAKEEVKKS